MLPRWIGVVLLSAGVSVIATCSKGISDTADSQGGLNWLPPTDAEDPGRPLVAEELTHIGVSLRTGTGSFDSTNSNKLSFCLSDDDCWRLNLTDVDDFRKGEIDHYSFEPSGLSREDIQTVELKSEDGNDAWGPDCLSVSLNGEQVYCQDGLDFLMGDDDDELESWSGPDGLVENCRSCWRDVLTHGPIQGAPRSDGADIWIRTDSTRSARLVLQELGTEGSWVADWNYARPENDFTLVLKAEGLLPNRDYTYTIELEDGEIAGPFSLRTASPPDLPGQFKVAFGSCSKLSAQPVFDALQESDLDLFLFAGDNHYGNTSDRDSLRWFYQWAHGLQYRQAFMAQTNILSTWDDHDFTGNNTDGFSEGKTTALDAFRNYWPNPSNGTDTTDGTFFSSRLGDLEFFMLDDRFHRGIDGIMLGVGQTEWLKEALVESKATFKLLVSGSQWTANGSSDSWTSFLEDRDALFEFIAQNRISGVVLLSGDIHRSSFRRLATVGGGYAFPELTSSPLSNTTTTCKTDDEVVACYSARPSYIQLDFDTTLKDPALVASLRDDTGTVREEWTILLSELATP